MAALEVMPPLEERIPEPEPEHRHRARRPVEAPAGVENWRELVEAYFPASEHERALCIMWHESRGNPAAKNPSSGASGLFQHLPKYWAERSSAAGLAGADIFDPAANVAVAAWLQNRGGWGHWSPWNRGLCH